MSTHQLISFSKYLHFIYFFGILVDFVKVQHYLNKNLTCWE